MRTLPLFSSVAHTPSGELATATGAAATGAGAAATGAGAGAAATGAGAGAGAGVMSLVTTGAGAATGAGAGVAATGAGAGAGAAATGATGAAATGAVVVVVAGAGASSFLSCEPRPFRSILPSLPLKPGALIWMQDSELQPRGDSIWMRWPSIWSVTAPPAWAEVVAKSSAVAAAKTSLFM